MLIAVTQVPTLSFLGGAGTVTGSRFLVEHGDVRVLLECGLYQGLKQLRRRNWEPFPVPPGSIDAVGISHAHLDHCGYLPALARDGFAGPIVGTAWTLDLAEIVLRDSAHLQEEDARYAAERGYSKHHPPRPLYTSEDVVHVLSLFSAAAFNIPTEVADDMIVTLRPAGHILGSSNVLLEVAGRRCLLSGDLGRAMHPLLLPPAPPPTADVVLVEATYGDRRHDPPHREKFADAIRRTVKRGGTVLIPAFAVDRTEVVLHTLRELMLEGQVPRIPVFVDSPMALSALAVYRQAIAAGSPDLRDDLVLAGRDPFDPGSLHESRSVEASIELNNPTYPCIIVSASGMASGGRVVHHLAHRLPDPASCVILVGYQAVGTRGRDLLDGVHQLKMLGRHVPVHAEIVDVPDFSVHADADELIEWLSVMPSPPDTCYVVHGEATASQVLAERISEELGWCAVVPDYMEKVRLD